MCATALQEDSPLRVGSQVLVRAGDAESGGRLGRAVGERYRCPEGFLDFTLTGKLSHDAGYFQFGADITCYGRSCPGTPDSIGSSVPLALPFDPTEIIDNLRLERYASRAGSDKIQKLLKTIYYFFRPLASLGLRKRVQKFRARNWRKLTFPHWPVDTTVEDICEKLLLLSMQARGVDSVPFVWFWPDGARGCVTMTHDVETEAGRDSCRKLIDLDDAFGIKASFQVVPEGRYRVSPELLADIRDRGFEVGLQDLNHDGRLFDDRGEFLRRARAINRYAAEFDATGFRSAVLYRNPEWFDALDVSYDMSIPNVAHLDPQRGGCCTVMPYFVGNVLEIPVTTVQDYMLFHILEDRSIDLWKSQIDLILKKNGLASFIIHPDYVMERDTRAVYEKLLGHLQDLRARSEIWAALPREIDGWWRARSQMRLLRDGRSWRIEGEQAERAVLAYAKNVNGKLVYRLERAAAAV
jgi:hypothetical protein